MKVDRDPLVKSSLQSKVSLQFLYFFNNLHQKNPIFYFKDSIFIQFIYGFLKIQYLYNIYIYIFLNKWINEKCHFHDQKDENFLDDSRLKWLAIS